MTTEHRRPARGQILPDTEAHLLTTLTPFDKYARAAFLFDSGWTLRAIGGAFSPPKPRSTVKSWIERAKDTVPQEPLPTAPIPAPPPAPEPIRPASPGISPYDQTEIARLSIIARKFRSGMAPLHTATLANKELTRICKEFREKGVTIRELSSAAGVTYRAMAKRLDKQ